MASALTSLSETDAELVGAERLYDELRAHIVFGHLSPGQKLTLDRLKASYGAGIGTLREVLTRLSAEMLVTAEGQRGFAVAPCSLAELRELAALRLLLESEALRASFARGDVEWEGRVVAAHHKLARLEERLLSGDGEPARQWKRYDFEFHGALVAACGSKALLDLHAGIYDRYLRYQMVCGIFRGAPAADEHRALLACALDRDADKAVALLRTHIESCVAMIAEAGTLR